MTSNDTIDPPVDLSATKPATSAMAPAPAFYRKQIEDKLKCPLHPAAIRRKVFAAAAAILAERAKSENAILLLDLSFRVEERLTHIIGQRSVFKLLFAIVLADAFEITPNWRLHEIAIRAQVAPVEEWDDLFVGVCLAGLRRDRPDCPIYPETLASAIDVPPATVRRLLQTPPKKPKIAE